MDEKFMREALKEAKKAFEKDEVPVGAIIVYKGKVVSKGHNLRESKNDPTAHAEIIALRKVAKKLGDWRLDECDIYVTLEPCPMCASAILYSRIKRVIFGAFDKDNGAFGSKINLLDIFANSKSHIDIKGGILKEECEAIIQSFFKGVRRKYNNAGRDG